MLFAGKWMELEIVSSEISQTEKDEYCMLSHMWNLETKQKSGN
jgi:hypothetical protein